MTEHRQHRATIIAHNEQADAARKLELWFFRDMNGEQRLKLLALFGLAVKGSETQGAQKLALRRILSTLAPLYVTSAKVRETEPVGMGVFRNGEMIGFVGIGDELKLPEDTDARRPIYAAPPVASTKVESRTDVWNAAFLAGFLASGEGFNGEHPFAFDPKRVEADEDFRAARALDIAAPNAQTDYAKIVAPYRAALRMIREAVETLFGPAANLESEEAELLRGPEPHHTAEAVIAALQNIAASIGWQPIETAPDGEVVDLFFANGERLTGFKRDRFGRFCREEGYPTFTRVLLAQPTHWMKVPKEPCDVR